MLLNKLQHKINAYPKVYNLGHKEIQGILDSPVILQEKVDGSQFSFLKTETDELLFKSKGAIIFKDSPPKIFQMAVDTVVSLKDKLRSGIIYRAEAITTRKHNTLFYDRIPIGGLILFDVMVGEENYNYKLSWAMAKDLGLEHVPILSIREPTIKKDEDFVTIQSFEELQKFLELESILGGTKIEGVVIKNYDKFGIDGKPLFGKFVSEQFKEKHQRNWKLANPNKGDVVDTIVNNLKTEARWKKAIQHLKEQDLLQNDVRDIGPLLKEIQNDIEEEELNYIKDMLCNWALPIIKRKIAYGFADWYKKKITESIFPSSAEEVKINNAIPD